MAQQPSPRGTFLVIAEVVRRRVENDASIKELPTASAIMSEFGVSRGLALRVLRELRKQGVARPVSGSRWQVARADQPTDSRSLHEKFLAVFAEDCLSVGDKFPSASALSSRFGVSRPTASKALAKLESAGWISPGRQGAVRKVVALPKKANDQRPRPS